MIRRRAKGWGASLPKDETDALGGALSLIDQLAIASGDRAGYWRKVRAVIDRTITEDFAYPVPQ